ncbi:hypothetical protein [Lapidilactobacillus wuchangensis]|uniref:hypothetical protein n=1 Tax=Lapidilactobacillus wuchangensis TaxID=2486001 RepID=UPI000F7963F0|nr:hypothetical protein [Lapidilactobacillus wuchangensis]
MLDDRLIGMTFYNTSQLDTGVVELFGVYYHYRIEGQAKFGDSLEVFRVSPLFLYVRRQDDRLKF